MENTLNNKKISLPSKLSIMSLIMLFSANVQAEKIGELLYMQNCMVCHADDGTGAMPGVFDLTENRNWSTLAEKQLLDQMKKGIKKPGAAVNMPAKGGNPNLKDKELLSIISYMRKEFIK